jgi:acyl-CoA thioesterase FadM
VDCHGNWTAAVSLMDLDGASTLTSTVTARFEVVLERPTPFGAELEVTSRVARLDNERRHVEVIVEVRASAKLTARGHGLFVEVEEGHPAYHRWD